MDEQLLTIAEAAAKCRVCEETIRRWMRDGYIAFAEVGPSNRNRRIRLSDLLRRKQNGKPAPSGTEHKDAGTERDATSAGSTEKVPSV